MKKVVTISGRSASGKSTLSRMLCETGAYAEATSTTTRAMRDGEVDGEHYHFVTREKFEDMWKGGEMVERIEYNSNLYGVSAEEFENIFDQGKAALIVCETDGVRQVRNFARERGWDVSTVYLDCPENLLIERFLSRFKEDGKASVKDYASRLMAMMGVEKSWRTDIDYDMVIDLFDTETQDKVIKEMMRLAG